MLALLWRQIFHVLHEISGSYGPVREILGPVRRTRGEDHLVALLADENLARLELKLLRQPHRLAAVGEKDFRCFGHVFRSCHIPWYMASRVSVQDPKNARRKQWTTLSRLSFHPSWPGLTHYRLNDSFPRAEAGI